MPFMIPSEIVDAARAEAKALAERALDGVFGLIQGAIMRRQSYAFAHEQAIFHNEMVRRLKATPIKIFGIKRKIKRHARLGMRWTARAAARDPRLAQVCGLYDQICEDVT
jgi:hypothetical protein